MNHYKGFYHLDYEVDNPRYLDFFWDNYRRGEWHMPEKPIRYMFWWKLMIRGDIADAVRDVEHDLNIYGMNNYPRFSYQFPNTLLEEHVDEDDMVAINLNLQEETPIIHLEGEPYPYEAAFVDVGHIPHSVEPFPHPRLVLKFAIRHPWEEVYERLESRGLIIHE